MKKRIVIVGGGSAGWMAAAYLDAALNWQEQQTADISLLESPDVPRIGVGEATIPSINHILAAVGLDELDFMRRTEATYKQAIKFRHWLTGDDEGYYHAFGRYTPRPVDDSGQRWLETDRSIPFMETVSAQPRLCEWNLAPKMFGRWDFGGKLTYAFHMNALAFADCLQELAISRGVRHYADHLAGVEQAENGDISAITTRGGLRLAADLYVDCTGFSARLIEGALGVPWVDFSRWLLCDRAVVMQIPYERHYPGFVRPYTLSTALSAGWAWDIPLQTRRGTGYVHSSAFISEEEAVAELRQYEGPHAADLPTRTLDFRVGMRERAWANNCVAIGLSGGFLEPLESTGLYLSDLATVMLAEHFPHRGATAAMSWRFNRIMQNRFYEVLDFINLHYCLTRRRDTAFWREVARSERITDRLAAKLDFWRAKPVSHADFEDAWFKGQAEAGALAHAGCDPRPPVDTGRLFTRSSYEAVLYGMDFLRDECDEWYGSARPPTGVYRQVAERLRLAPSKLPPHELWLQRMTGMPSFPQR